MQERYREYLMRHAVQKYQTNFGLENNTLLTNLSMYRIAQRYQMAIELIQSHCRSQELRNHMKQIEKTSLQKYCDDKPNKFWKKNNALQIVHLP